MPRAARTIELAVPLAAGPRGPRPRQRAGRLAARRDPQALGFRSPPRVVRLARFVRLLLQWIPALLDLPLLLAQARLAHPGRPDPDRRIAVRLGHVGLVLRLLCHTLVVGWTGLRGGRAR